MNCLRAGRCLMVGVILFVALCPGLSRAADDSTVIFPASASRAEAKNASSGGFGALTLVAGLILAGAGAWFLLRGRRTIGVSRAPRNLMIDETRSLGSRQYLVVASYEGKKFLLGVCPGKIDMLTTLSDSTAGEFRQ
jgi:flagellar protein FliO/FliZ